MRNVFLLFCFFAFQLGAQNGLFFRPAADTNSHRWCLLLPGQGGLKIFDDTSHYFNYARLLNENGFHVILLDYMKYFKKHKLPFGNSVPEIIVASSKHAIQSCINDKKIGSADSAFFVAWSLGAEGALKMANDSILISNFNIRKLALFYPSNRFYDIYKSYIPVLVQTGTDDNVTRLDDILKVFDNKSSALIITYPGAAHGFDVQSLIKERSLRFPPVVGPKFTLKYNEKAAVSSNLSLMEFLLK